MCKRIKLKISNKLNLQIKVYKVYMSFEASFQTSTLSLIVMCQEHLHVHLTSYGCNKNQITISNVPVVKKIQYM